MLTTTPRKSKQAIKREKEGGGGTYDEITLARRRRLGKAVFETTTWGSKTRGLNSAYLKVYTIAKERTEKE